MARRFIVRPLAEADLEDAARWYEDERAGLSTDDGRRVTYEPRRLQGVTLYREAERAFAQGDRVQFTAPDRSRDVANRELGIIERVDSSGRLQVRTDSGRTVTFEKNERRHLDYGYAVTSHRSQGQTADRVLVHVETDRAGEKLVNRRLAYWRTASNRRGPGHMAGSIGRSWQRSICTGTIYAMKPPVVGWPRDWTCAPFSFCSAMRT
jgi:hypothetical protein